MLIPAISLVTHHLAPYSDLDQNELQLAIFSAIMLVGRLVALPKDDLGAILNTGTNTHGFKHDLTTMLTGYLPSKIPVPFTKDLNNDGKHSFSPHSS